MKDLQTKYIYYLWFLYGLLHRIVDLFKVQILKLFIFKKGLYLLSFWPLFISLSPELKILVHNFLLMVLKHHFSSGQGLKETCRSTCFHGLLIDASSQYGQGAERCNTLGVLVQCYFMMFI